MGTTSLYDSGSPGHVNIGFYGRWVWVIGQYGLLLLLFVIPVRRVLVISAYHL